jgi:multiple sugar transport system ATP-binding protein
VQQIGTPAQVYARPANRFVAGFLGAPSMNFIDGAVTAANAPDAPAARFQAGLLEVALPGRAACGPATLGVRPEHVCLEPGGALAARVTLVEPMGNHQVVWLDAGGQLLSSIVHDAASYAPGQAVRFRIDGAQVSLFDPVDGRRMQYASGYADQPIAALNE